MNEMENKENSSGQQTINIQVPSADNIASRRSLIPLFFTIVIIFFFFNFFTVSCGGQKFERVKGIELVTGTELKNRNLFTGEETKGEKVPPCAWAIIAFGAAVIGLGAFLIKEKREEIIGTGAGVIGFSSLLILQFVVKNAIEKKAQGTSFEIDFQFAYWGALIAMGIAGFISYLRMKKTYNLVVVSVPSQSTSIPLTENLTQPQSTAPTVLPSENFDSGKWFRKNKKMVIFLCFAVIVLYGLYYFFLKHGPEKDGKKIAITYCNCGKEKTKQQIKVYKNFIADFDSHKFTRRRLAQTALGTLLNPIYKSYQKCEDKVESDYTKYKERFVTDKEKVEKYEYAVNAQQQICNDEKETILSDLKVQFQSKINGIPDLESDINTILANKYGSKYRVIMDDDINWDKYDLENFVVPGRKKFEYYPYIVKGDFNGNGISDLAAIVKNTENNYTRLVIIWGGTNKIKFYDGQLCSAISFIPANEWKSHWEQGTVNLYADAILVECYEKSSWILYWDGYQIQQYWMSD
jgi:hypothetical protein